MRSIEQVMEYIMSELDKYFVIVAAGKATNCEMAEVFVYSKLINFIKEEKYK